MTDRIVLARFQLTNMVVTWYADPEEEWSEVRSVEIGRDSIHENSRERFTDNIFGRDACEAFEMACRDALSRHSRSMVTGWAQQGFYSFQDTIDKF